MGSWFMFDALRKMGLIFIFDFFNNILILTCFGPTVEARQVASVMPSRLARQGCHADGPTRRCASRALTWASLSRQVGWRDKVALPRQPLSQPRMGCILAIVAREKRLVAPLRMAQQAPHRTGITCAGLHNTMSQ